MPPFAAPTMVVVVNGPEDAPVDWRQVDLRRVEDEVRRLRQRIFTASKAGTWSFMAGGREPRSRMGDGRGE